MKYKCALYIFRQMVKWALTFSNSNIIHLSLIFLTHPVYYSKNIYKKL